MADLFSLIWESPLVPPMPHDIMRSLVYARGRLGACSVVNIKPARVGGYLAARALHDLCAAHGVPVWCGGMLETGVGRAANLALAALENFTLPGAISATVRYFSEDITRPFVLEDGHISVPRRAWRRSRGAG